MSGASEAAAPPQRQVMRVIELQLAAFIMVYSGCSGLVPLLDLLFPALIAAYILALSRLAFPSIITPQQQQQEEKEMVFSGGGGGSTTVGLLLPLGYVLLGGFARGDNQAVRWATPHLFLLSSQILNQKLITGCSSPVRALLPILYALRRLFVLIDWLSHLWSAPLLNPQDAGWWWFGRGLALANLLYFSLNLFCFLIPRFLPKAFENYFTQRDEVFAKTAQDRNTCSPNYQTKKTD